MKIIKKGTIPSKRIWRGTCRECKSEFEAKESEMNHITYDCREGGAFSWEQCPVCKAGHVSGYGGVLFFPVRD